MKPLGTFFKTFCTAVLFDMDGTLVDSTAVVERGWAVWGARHGIPLDQLLAFSHGRPTLDTMQHFRPGGDWQKEADEMRIFEETEIAAIQPVPGAPEAVAAIEPSAWAVVTSAPRQLAKIRLAAAGLPIPRVLVPIDEISFGKPHPEGYLKAAALLKRDPRNCVVFEDTPAGIEAGRRAGMQVIALATTFPADKLSCDDVIRDFRDIRFTTMPDGFFAIDGIIRS